MELLPVQENLVVRQLTVVVVCGDEFERFAVWFPIRVVGLTTDFYPLTNK